MKISIVYFSGTGNTKAIAEGYNELLLKKGHSVEILSIEESVVMSDHDLLIIGGPIYAGNMPDELINWVRKNVKSVENKGAIVYSTSAGLLNANGVKSIGKKLEKKGYNLIDLVTFEMPRNFYIDKYEPTAEEVQKKEFGDAANKIVESVGCFEHPKLLKVEESVLMMDLLADLFRVMAKFMGTSFAINENCVGCGLCEANCPKKNINYREKKYHHNCMMCTRCIHNCPVNAISYKGKHIEQYRVHDHIL